MMYTLGRFKFLESTCYIRTMRLQSLNVSYRGPEVDFPLINQAEVVRMFSRVLWYALNAAIGTTRPIPPNRRSCQVVPNPSWRAPTSFTKM